MMGFGGMLAFEITDDYKTPVTFMSKLAVISPALSLGGVESLICLPALTSHKGLPPAERLKVGITDNLLRLSVGIEDAKDIIDDLKQALNTLYL